VLAVVAALLDARDKEKDLLLDAGAVTLGWLFVHCAAFPLTLMLASPLNASVDVLRVRDVLSESEARWVVNVSEVHAAKVGGWSTARHENYPTTDVAVEDLPAADAIETLIRSRVLPVLTSFYSVSTPTLRDLFVVKYSSDGQRSLRKHTDGCELSFGIALGGDGSRGATEFVTFKHALRDVKVGEAWMHPSLALHRGRAVAEGETRYILVGFVRVPFSWYRTWGAWATRLREWRLVESTRRELSLEAPVRASRCLLAKRRIKRLFFKKSDKTKTTLLYVAAGLSFLLVVLAVDLVVDGLRLLAAFYWPSDAAVQRVLDRRHPQQASKKKPDARGRYDEEAAAIRFPTSTKQA